MRTKKRSAAHKTRISKNIMRNIRAKKAAKKKNRAKTVQQRKEKQRLDDSFRSKEREN